MLDLYQLLTISHLGVLAKQRPRSHEDEHLDLGVGSKGSKRVAKSDVLNIWIATTKINQGHVDRQKVEKRIFCVSTRVCVCVCFLSFITQKRICWHFHPFGPTASSFRQRYHRDDGHRDVDVVQPTLPEGHTQKLSSGSVGGRSNFWGKCSHGSV